MSVCFNLFRIFLHLFAFIKEAFGEKDKNMDKKGTVAKAD